MQEPERGKGEPYKPGSQKNKASGNGERQKWGIAARMAKDDPHTAFG